MWPATFEERLSSWHTLRKTAASEDLESAMNTINDWWFTTPIISHHLHWDEYKNWPTPWDLLADNMFCDIARAVGIVYTIAIIEHPEVQDIEMVRTDHDNLVLVNQGKYILNWAPRHLLNISFDTINIKQRLSVDAIRHLLG
jgi:hypothetical protein